MVKYVAIPGSASVNTYASGPDSKSVIASVLVDRVVLAHDLERAALPG